MKYKAKKDYDKGDGIAQFGDYQKHLRLLEGEEVEITTLPKEYEKYIEPVGSKSTTKSEGDK